MITLKTKLRRDGQKVNGSSSDSGKRASIRDQLLLKEVQELEDLPTTCEVKFNNPNVLHDFILTITPEEGHWLGGIFKFQIKVTEDYNMTPPLVRCETRIWHPNISEDGSVCLSLLRQNSLDGLGWAPTRKLKDVVWGLNSLFTDLLNFEDPLNMDASDMFRRDPNAFQAKVRQYIHDFARR